MVTLVAYQLLRLVAFINIYGGIEHDGGWALGVSRSLAETGAFTSMVSTIEDPTVIGGFTVDQKFEIQAPNGGIWFRISDVAGTSIVVDALVIKLFGAGFWALVGGPLLFYALLILLASYITYRLAGLGAVLLFHIFIYSYPHLSIFLSYQALREAPAMAVALAAFVAFSAALNRPRGQPWWLLLAGLLCGLAINAKLLVLLSLSGLFIWAVLLLVVGQPRLRWREVALLGLGAGLAPLTWEVIQLVVLVRVAGFELFLQRTGQRFDFFLDGGSGIRAKTYSGAEFLWDKFFMLEQVGHPQPWVTALLFAALLGGGLFLVWQWRGQVLRQSLLACLWLGWLANTAWFVSLAKTGWARHYWFGLVLAVVLLSVIPVSLLKMGWPRPARGSPYRLAPGLGLVLLLLLGWSFASQPHVWGFFIPEEIVPYWLEKQLSNKYQANLPWIILPRQAQAEVVNYINSMPPEANVYYPFAHKAAEIPPLTGRVNYPLQRRYHPASRPHPADILLVAPSIVSPWVHDPVMRQDLLAQVKQFCPEPELSNDYYIICRIEKMRLPPVE